MPREVRSRLAPFKSEFWLAGSAAPFFSGLVLPAGRFRGGPALAPD